ncbi:MAG: response regulator transcription factor [Clostridia bacterium]|nr:response regulator transcription factor [Clostridia bacterium]MBR3875474.1 response regulator transcription factor [Clostridia bacterium]
MARILVVEDDLDLNRILCRTLTNRGYDVTSADNGISALSKTEEQTFDMIITDIMMPKMDGFELADSIRLTNKEIPIIFMTARDDKPSKMLGYSIGIDDYIVKPFDMDILLMKIGAILRRARIEAQNELSVGNFRMNREERSAYIDEEEINLTVREFDILFKLLSYPKKTFTRSALMEEFWDFDSSATSRTVDVYMVKLREKTAAADGFEIQTVHGLGYKLVLK